MKRRPLAPPLAVVWTIVLGLQAGCTGGSTAPAEPRPKIAAQPHSDEPAHEALPRRVRLSPEVVAAAGIRTAPIAREALVLTVPLPGEIVADPDRTARVASPIAGRIERVAVREGSAVKKGEIVAMIRVPDLGRLRATLSATLGKAKAARANAERLKGLSVQRLASEQLYLDALAAAEALELEVRASQEQLAALGLGAGATAPSQLTLRAPLAGVVVSRNAVVGQPVTADEVLADIVDLSEVWFLARVFEKDLGRLRPGALAEVQLNAYPHERFEGVVEYIGRQVDAAARTVTARVRLQNRDEKLRVGLFGAAYVNTEHGAARQLTIVVPRSALTEVAGKPVVFVRQADQDFELHDVVLGDSAAGKVQVLAGLREGEQVAVEGVFSLKSAVLKSTITEDE